MLSAGLRFLGEKWRDKPPLASNSHAYRAFSNVNRTTARLMSLMDLKMKRDREVRRFGMVRIALVFAVVWFAVAVCP